MNHFTQIDLAPSDMNIAVKMPDGSMEYYELRDSMKINDRNLSQEFTQQPAVFAFYSGLLETAQDKLAIAKTELKRYKAELATLIRQGKHSSQAATAPIPEGKVKTAKDKLTIDAINDLVECDKKHQVLADEVEAWEAKCGRLRVWTKSSEQRKDMLIQLGLLARQEYRSTGVQTTS